MIRTQSVLQLLLVVSTGCQGYFETQSAETIEGLKSVVAKNDIVYGIRGRKGVIAYNVTKEKVEGRAAPELFGAAERLYIEGEFGYLAEGLGGVAVYDLIDQSQPSRIGSIQLGSKQSAELLAVAGNRAFAYCTSRGGSRSIFILDVSNPEEPQKLDKVTVPRLTSLESIGAFLYAISPPNILTYEIGQHTIKLVSETQYNTISCCLTKAPTFIAYPADGEIHIIDGSNTEISSVYITQEVTAMLVQPTSGYLYAMVKGGFAVVDVANEKSPFLMLTNESKKIEKITSMTIVKDVIYAVEESGKTAKLMVMKGLPVRAVRDPGSSESASADDGSAKNSDATSRSTAKDEVLNQAASEVTDKDESSMGDNSNQGSMQSAQDERIIEAPETPGPPAIDLPSAAAETVLRLPSPPKHLISVGGTLIVTVEGRGMALLDIIGNRKHPAMVASKPITSSIGLVSYDPDRGFVYVADHNGFRAYSGDTTMLNVAMFEFQPFEGTLRHVIGYGSVVYAFLSSSYNSYMYILDFSAVDEPFGVAKMDTHGEVTDAVRFGKILIAVTTEKVVMVWDLTSPKTFNLRWTHTLSHSPTAIDTDGEYLFIGEGTHLSVTKLYETGISRVNVNAKINDLKHSRGFVYAAADSGLLVIDTRNLKQPYVAAIKETAGPAKYVEVRDQYVYYIDDQALTVMSSSMEGLKEVATGNNNAGGSEESTGSNGEASTVIEDLEFGSNNEDDMTKAPPESAASAVQHPTGVVKKPSYHGKRNQHSELLISPHIDVDIREGAPTMPGWASNAESKITSLPQFLVKSRLYLPKETLPPGTDIDIVCLYDSCMVYIMLEYCHPCSHDSDGGYPQLLINEGWYQMPCAPKFQVRIYGKTHEMAMFAKRLYHKDVEKLPKTVRNAGHVVLAVISDTDCARFTTLTACRHQYKVLGCMWDQILGRCTAPPPDCAPSPPVEKCSCAAEEESLLM